MVYYINSDITSNTTWNTGDVYNIISNIKVDSGVTLTVDDGVTINMYDGSTAYNLNVEGTLTVNGGASRVIIIGKVQNLTSAAANITLYNCDFSGVVGGYYNYGIETYDGMLAVYGCTFTGYAYGGINARFSTTLTLEDSTFENGGVGQPGCGGIFVSCILATINNCRFSGFNNSGYGVNCIGSLNFSIRNCLIDMNTIGVKLDSCTAAQITNCTIADNLTKGVEISAGTNNITNSIIYYNTNNLDIDLGSSPTVNITYSCIEGGYGGTGNITDNPLFAKVSGRATVEDYRLKSTGGRWNGAAWVTDSQTSTCIDAGNPSSAYGDEPMPNGFRINMGFDGNTIYASLDPPVFLGLGMLLF